VVGVLLVLTGIQGTVRALVEEFGSDTAAGYVGLISPFTLVDGVVATVLGGESVMEVPPEGALMAVVFCAVAVGVVVASYAVLVRRYRRAIS
jgi:ABC-2 type transport system permease protein